MTDQHEIRLARFHGLNALSLIIAGSCLAVTLSGKTAPIARVTLYWLALPLSLLLISECLALAEKHGPAGVLAIVGGLLLGPMGLPSIFAGLWLRRRFRKIDRAVEKIICLRCGYDARGNPTLVCPECGCLSGFTKSIQELGITKDDLLNTTRHEPTDEP